MTLKGHVRDGRIELDEPTNLPEGAPVTIELDESALDDGISPKIRAISGILPRDLDVKEDYIQSRIEKHR